MNTPAFFDIDEVIYGGPVCACCGERPTATAQHNETARKHIHCVSAMLKAQHLCNIGASVDEIRSALDAAIGPLDIEP